MKKQSASRSSFFIPRAALGLVLLLFGLSIGLLAQGPNTPGAFTPSNNMPPARFGMGMAYDAAREQVVLFGGGVDCCSGNYFNDTWTWDGTTWTQRFPATSPPARTNLRLAYDAQRGEVVLFGGRGDTAELNDTWTWDGTTWTEQHPSTVPPVRDNPGLAYDAQRGEAVMFGGYQGCFHCNPDDTWIWDGVTWTQEFPTRSPSGRDTMGMVYDALRGEVVLFGGVFFPTTYNDTWTWNGSNWRRESPPASPPARAGLAMAYDEVRGNAVIFGGDSIPGLFNDTWEWDGTTWTQRFPATSPSARSSSAMTYDAARGRIVLFGGGDADGAPLGDTWTWDGTTWLLQAPTTQDCLQPPAGLVSWWAGDGTAQDVQGTNPGKLKNGASFTKGKVGPAFLFDGIDDGVAIANSSSLSQTRITLNAWVYLTGKQGTNRHIISKDNGSQAREYILAATFYDTFTTNVWLEDGFHEALGTTPIQLNTWYHVAMTHDGTKLNLYVNGVLEASSDAVGDIVFTANPVGIGGNKVSEVSFEGIIDEAQIFSRALTDAEILAIYQAGADGQCKPDIFVASIDPSFRIRGNQYLISTSVTIQDVNGLGIGDARVQIKTTFPDRQVLTFSVTTDQTGQATLTFSTTSTGLYEFKVRRVTHPTREYDASLNIETRDTLLIP